MADQWILDMTMELQRPHDALDQEQYAKSIYRVPKILTDVNSQAYQPKLVSFGPYHHDRLHLRPMEQHKQRAVVKFLRRIAKASKTPEDVLVAMRDVEPRLFASYDSLRNEYEEEDCLERSRFRHRDWRKEKDEFLKLMIVDGCFALELMLAEKRSATGEHSDYDSHDSIFGAERKNYVIPDLKRDMLLLENQIPILALTTLTAIDGSEIGDVSTLIKISYDVSSDSFDYALTNEGLNGPTERSFHILDLYRKILTGDGEYLPSYEENVQSATELRNAGVSFCKNNTKSFRDISFNGGVLSLPVLDIDDTTESLLLNLMAFERLHATAGNEVTAYVFFMDGLINTVDDVALLRTEGIIMGWVGCDLSIANMINNITKEAILVLFKDDMQVNVNSRLNNYCKKRMRRWRASLVETYLKNWVFTSFSTYLKNPWVFTLLGGLFLLALTIVQTVYTVRQFYEA